MNDLQKKTVKVIFLDFWSGFDYKSMNFYIILCETFNVKVVENHADADYVFYSCFGCDHWNVKEECIKIFITAENITPDFNACDYAIGFDWLDFGDRYLRFSNFYSPFYRKNIADLIEHRTEYNIPLKSEFCSFVVSNGYAAEFRVKLFEELCNYKKVNSGGRYLNNIGGPVEDKLLFEQKHKFSICCENSSHRGYTTEKLYQAFAARTIPIYWGDPDVERVFNPDSFINCNKYDCIEDIVNTIKNIDNDDALYFKMINAPVYINNEENSYDFQLDRLRKFIFNIFNQNNQEARRYSRHNAHFNYTAQMRRINKISKMSIKEILIQKIFH